MNKSLVTISTALFAFLGAFFSAGTAQAQTITLPEQFSYEGLTFIEPLTYANPQKTPAKKALLRFSVPEKVLVKNTGTKENEKDNILFPTMTTTMTLPILPTQEPPLIKKAEERLSPTPTPKISQALPTQTSETTPTLAPTTPQPSANVGGLDPEKLFAMSNAYRQSRGLAPFQKDDRSCSLAASRAPEIAAEVASGTMHAGLRARALPYWNTENIISMRTEEAAFNWWVNDKIHHDAIVGNYTYSCVACSGNSCAQEFTNFQPK